MHTMNSRIKLCGNRKTTQGFHSAAKVAEGGYGREGEAVDLILTKLQFLGREVRSQCGGGRCGSGGADRCISEHVLAFKETSALWFS